MTELRFKVGNLVLGFMLLTTAPYNDQEIRFHSDELNRYKAFWYVRGLEGQKRTYVFHLR